MTLLGSYWFGLSQHLPSAALVALLAEFGVSEPSSRAALNRLAKRGLLASSKRGRNTYYGLHPAALPLIEDRVKRDAAFGSRQARQWDGCWTMVGFSVPEVRRDIRHSIRTNLRWHGFAALYDGLWCSPWDEREAALAVFAELSVPSATIMRAQIDERSGLQPLAAWDLDAVRQHYHEFEARFASMLDDVRSGALTASETLVARTNVLDCWRELPRIEPDLPAELLPDDWPRATARQLFLELYTTLAPVAKARCQQIIGEHSPELAELVTHPPFEPIP